MNTGFSSLHDVHFYAPYSVYLAPQSAYGGPQCISIEYFCCLTKEKNVKLEN